MFIMSINTNFTSLNRLQLLSKLYNYENLINALEYDFSLKNIEVISWVDLHMIFIHSEDVISATSERSE